MVTILHAADERPVVARQNRFGAILSRERPCPRVAMSRARIAAAEGVGSAAAWEYGVGCDVTHEIWFSTRVRAAQIVRKFA